MWFLLMTLCLRPLATRQTPVVVSLHAAISQGPDLQEIAMTLGDLTRWASNPLSQLVGSHREALALMAHLKWLLLKPAVWEQLGPSAEVLHDQVEVLETLLEIIGWTPTTAMQLLEITRQWRWAQEGI